MPNSASQMDIPCYIFTVRQPRDLSQCSSGDEAFSQFGLRVIAPDRPGMGQSDFQPKRGFSDWPTDVTALVDVLGLDRFSILGNSGGGGYAAVCAAKIPERLRLGFSSERNPHVAQVIPWRARSECPHGVGAESNDHVAQR